MNTPQPTSILALRVPAWLAAALVVLALAFGLAGGLGAGLLFGRLSGSAIAPAACPESEQVCAEFAVFWEAWELARERYVEADAAVPDQMIAGAVNGMLDTLGDSGHTRFLTAEEAADWDEALRGSFEGIGAYVDVRDGQAIIVAPIEGAPAEAAGLRPGDEILAVDGQPTDGWTIDELTSRVRGPGGTDVTLTVLHPGEAEPVDITITRAEVVVPAVSWRMLPDEVAHIQLSSFDDDAGAELERALEAAGAAGARAIILDLRNNPGGLLSQAVDVAGQFLPRGTTVLLEANRDGERDPTRTRSAGAAQEIPLVVLVNQNSASSAEIVSGALQAAGRATLVGEPTFGTGTVLTPYRLSDGSRLLLGTEQWLTPEGELIRGRGITPDVLVSLPETVAPLSPAEAAALSPADLRASEDIQLAEAYGLANAAAAEAP